MAYIEPNTSIYFLSGIPFDPTYENTMVFDSAQAQYDYMISHLIRGFEDNSYQRKNRGVLKVGYSIDGGSSTVISLLYNANYMMFKNTNFENKWFYAFVTKVEYINNNTVEIYYSIDVIQTWMFDFQFNDCLIEREHTVTDTFGSNLIPENLELGDYVISRPATFDYNPCICVVTTFDSNGDYAPGQLVKGYGGVHSTYFSGLHYNYFQLTQINELNAFLEDFSSDAKAPGVVAVFMCAYEFRALPLGSTAYTIPNYTSYKFDNVECLGDGSEANNGYVPRNKKLLTYPYNMLYCTNYQGSSVALKFEYFSNPSNIELEMYGNGSTNPGLIFWPKNYNGKVDNFEEGLTVTGFPLCAWTYDSFKAWLSQNAGTITASGIAAAVGVGKFTIAAGSGIAAGALMDKYSNGGVHLPSYKGDMELANSMMQNANASLGQLAPAAALLSQVYDHYIKPPTNQGNGNGNLQYQAGNMTVMFCKKHIRPQFAKVIDSFFDMYGYASHRVGKPNLKARPCYSYVKTVGASIDGNVPTDDIVRIEQIFDKGVRFWRTTATFGSFDPNVNDNRV